MRVSRVGPESVPDVTVEDDWTLEVTLTLLALVSATLLAFCLRCLIGRYRSPKACCGKAKKAKA